MGELIFAEARREVTHFENTVSVIDGLSRSEIGYLRLAVTPSVANAILPKIIQKFVQKHPKIQIDIRDMDSVAIADELKRERVDIGIGTLPELDGMNRTKLFSDPFGVVCRTDHPLAQDWDRLTWRTMKDYVLIANGLCDQINDPDFSTVHAKSRLQVHNTTSLLGLVREGVGITVLPQLAVTELQDDIVFLPLADITARRTVHIVSQPMNLLMPAAREFFQLIVAMSADGALALDP